MTERIISITLTQTQCNTLANLIDVAIRAGGVQNAKLGVPFITMLEDGLNGVEDVWKDKILEPDVTTKSDPKDPLPTAHISGKATINIKDLDGNSVQITGDSIKVKGKDVSGVGP